MNRWCTTSNCWQNWATFAFICSSTLFIGKLKFLHLMNSVKNPPNIWFITSRNPNRGFICLLSQATASMFIFAVFCDNFSSSASFYSSFSALRVSGDSFSPLSHKQSQLNIFVCCVWKKKKTNPKAPSQIRSSLQTAAPNRIHSVDAKTKCEGMFSTSFPKELVLEFWLTFLFENAKTTWKLQVQETKEAKQAGCNLNESIRWQDFKKE